jgi:alpha-methylacyl-CoA racemase
MILGTDACAVPVLTPKEAGRLTSHIPIFHPQLKAGQYLDPKIIVIQPGVHTDEVLQDLGFNAERIKQLKDEGVFGKSVSSKL